jgi:hypothetical protein
MNIEPGTLVLIAAGCSVICVVLFVLGTFLNALGVVFELLGGVFEIAVNLFNMGPLPGCGCIALLLALVICVGGGLAVNSIVSSCGTAQQMNFCRLLGY